MNIHIVNYKEINTSKRLYLICGFPGSGLVGKLAVDHLIKELKAELVADIYSSALPPQVVIRSDGTLDLTKNSIYYWQDDDKVLLLLTADFQPILPDAEYELAEAILSLPRSKIDMVFTLAAYITGVFVNKPKVYIASTNKSILDEFAKDGLEVMDGGNITGMNGVMLGVARLKNIDGVCLLGETSGYFVDANASKAVLKVLTNKLKLKIDMSELEERIKDSEPIIKALEQQMQQEPTQQKPKDLGYIS